MANEFQQGPQPNYQQPMGPQPGFQPGFQPQGTPQMQIGEAIQRWLANLTNFNGRARRSEFWWVMLVVGVGGWLLNLIFGAIGGTFGGILQLIVGIAEIILTASLLVRRLQDTGKPAILAWIFYGLYAIVLIMALITVLSAKSGSAEGAVGGLLGTAALSIILMIYGIVLLIFLCMDSNMGPNKYGPSEKYPG